MKKLNLRMLSQYPKWHDKPLRLTTAEMNDPHLVLEDFFQAYSLSDTRACLKELLEDALSANDVNPMSHFTLYDHIEKLIEAAFLIHQKKESTPDEETDLAGETARAGTEENGDCHSEGNPYSKPKRLVDKVKTHPMNGLKEIFRLVDLEDLTQHLRSWIKVALLSEQSNYEQASERAALIAFSEGFLPLMEALYLKSEVARLQHASGWLDELPRGLRRELERSAPLTYLTGEQINHPAGVLEAFCDRFSLQYGRAELWDLLDGVISYEGADLKERTEKPNLLLYYDCFSALLEAAYRLNDGSGPQSA